MKIVPNKEISVKKEIILRKILKQDSERKRKGIFGMLYL